MSLAPHDSDLARPGRRCLDAAQRAREHAKERRMEEERRQNQKELWEIRPRHSRKWAQGSKEWAQACDLAYRTAVGFSLLEILFSPAQARDFEAYVQRHGTDRNEVLAEILHLGFKASNLAKEAARERNKEKRAASGD